MNIILKNSLKNIFGKPFRTLLVVFSIFVCSLCALLSFDLVSGFKGVLTGIFGSISKADIMFVASDYSTKGLPDGFPSADMMELSANSEQLYKDIEGEYAYVTSSKLSIYGLDVDDAVKMKFLDPVEIGYKETAISAKFAKDYGYSAGDTLLVHDRAEGSMELKIVSVLSNDTNNIFLRGYVALVNMDTATEISCGRTDKGVLMIDIDDDSLVEDAIKMLEEYYPESSVMRTSLTAEDYEMINEIASVLYLLFAITFLLVIFVTASICNRIVSERMSFIGTLRSLGMSTLRTGRILLLENVLYAVLGSVPAVILYALVRGPMFEMLFVTSSDDIAITIPKLSVFLVAGIILGAVAVECLIPLRAIVKALGTSIRDIIFDNRDTEYKYNKAGLIIGIVFAAGSIVAFFFRTKLTGATCCLVSGVTSLAFLFPWIFKCLTTLINNLAAKRGNAKWAFASVEARSRKSTVGSGVLCVTAAAMSVVIFAIAQTAIASFSKTVFDCDVIVSCDDKVKAFKFIDKLDSVTDTSVIYGNGMYVTYNDEEKSFDASFFAMQTGGYKYFNYFTALPDSLDEGSIIVDAKFASRKGIKEGDVIKITYDPDGFFPIGREYKVAGIVEPTTMSTSSGVFVITEEEYKEIFRDQVGYYLIKCEDPDYVANMINTYASASIANCQTMQEYIDESTKEETSLVTILTIVIVVAVGMTFVGMVSNQLIGFEGRKKECAVLLSTAMGRGKLSGILFLEMLMTSVTASVIGTVAGYIFAKIIGAATANSDTIFMEIEPDPVKGLLFCIFLIVVFTGTVLFPIKNLKKMKISEQLKYE